ncbi:MAG: phytanoyl-CoA dioxygenase family protein [Sphingobium sp.]
MTRQSWVRWLKMPWWALQLLTSAKSFRDNPIIGSRRLNAMGLHVARARIAHMLARSRRKRLAYLLSAEDRAQFDAQGYVQIPDFLPRAAFAKLRAAIFSRLSPAREMVQGDTITRRIAIDQTMLRDIPALGQLLQSDRWRGLMRYVASFDVEPLYYIQTILAHHVDASPDPQTALHADTFHPTMKAWFFLTDVAGDEGPLTYVAGSHRWTRERGNWEKQRSLLAPDGIDLLSARGSMRIETQELPAIGLPPATVFAVSANTLVVADTCGFHARGPSAHPSLRIEIWAYSRRSPFLPWTGGDPLSLPWLAPRRIGWMWAMHDRWKKYIGQAWQDVGVKRPDSADDTHS